MTDNKNDHQIAFFHSIWFLSGQEKDLLIQVYKKEGKWQMSYRFRYYDKAEPRNDPFSGKDKKSGYLVQALDDSDESMRMMADAARMVSGLAEREWNGKVDVVEMNCYNNDPKFLVLLSAKPWAHIKKLEKQ